MPKQGIRVGGRRLIMGINDLESARPDLMEDWDWEKTLNTHQS